MRFLADMGISPQTVKFLQQLGHPATHRQQESLERLNDAQTLAKACHEGSILLTRDLGFGDLSAAGAAYWPSVIIFRFRYMRPDKEEKLLLP